MNFTKRRFLAFKPEQQHNKFAEMLRAAYESTDESNKVSLIDMYNEAAKWIDLPLLLLPTPQNIADRYHHHAKIASIQHKEHNLLPNIRQGDKSTGESPWNIAIYLDNIRSAHNVGSILRTTEAFALGTVYFSDSTPYASHKQVKDAAMGADEWIDCRQGIPLNQLPRPLIAMETAATATPLFDYTFPDTFTLAVGNEEYGCSPETLLSADTIIEIPLRGRKNSLNVANAFAIAAAEISRQRKQKRI